MAFPWLGLGDGEGFEVSPMTPFDTFDADGVAALLDPSDTRCAAVLDTETEGLDPSVHRAIEIGIRSFYYSRSTGVVHGLVAGGSYDAFEDPGRPLSAEITKLTGITDADVKGQRIDRDRVAALLAEASIVISHNAGFDRPFIDRMVRVPGVVWACSIEQVDWTGHGLPSTRLAALTVMHGFCARSHRAGSDAEATLRLLATVNAQTQRTYLAELLDLSREEWVRIVALGSPFELKETLKARGYSWAPPPRKAWRRVLPARLEADEMQWLREHIYRSREIPAISAPVPMADRFREEV